MAEGKSDFGADIPVTLAKDIPEIRPVLAAGISDTFNWWPELAADVNAEAPLEPVQQTAEGKSDIQVVVRDGKGNPEPSALAMTLN